MMMAPIRRVETPHEVWCGVLQLVVAPRELDIEGFCEAVPEIMGGAALQALAVVHQGLYRIGGHRPGELFLSVLRPFIDRALQGYSRRSPHIY